MSSLRRILEYFQQRQFKNTCNYDLVYGRMTDKERFRAGPINGGSRWPISSLRCGKRATTFYRLESNLGKPVKHIARCSEHPLRLFNQYSSKHITANPWKILSED